MAGGRSPPGAAKAGKGWPSDPLSRSRRTRLTDSPEFERAYRQGKAYRGELFTVHAFPNELGVARLGMSVSKKVGNAVTRNTVRRRIRQVFRSTPPDQLRDRDIVVSARPAVAGAAFEDLQHEFLRSLEKLNNVEPYRKR